MLWNAGGLSLSSWRSKEAKAHAPVMVPRSAMWPLLCRGHSDAALIMALGVVYKIAYPAAEVPASSAKVERIT